MEIGYSPDINLVIHKTCDQKKTSNLKNLHKWHTYSLKLQKSTYRYFINVCSHIGYSVNTDYVMYIQMHVPCFAYTTHHKISLHFTLYTRTHARTHTHTHTQLENIPSSLLPFTFCICTANSLVGERIKA